MNRKEIREIATGLGFLLPNILGFLAFTAVPLVISLVMAFTDWNLEMHNMFKDNTVQFIWFDNFIKLFADPDFIRYLSNTLFMMMGIPFGIAGSLFAAMLLNNDFKGGSKRIWGICLASVVLIISISALMLAGMHATATMMLITAVLGVILLIGCAGGQTVYRTLFYFPHFTAGVSTYILWKKLYSPENGPINNALRKVLDSVSPFLAQMSDTTAHAIANIMLIVAIALIGYSFWRKIKHWLDGDCGSFSLAISLAILSIALILTSCWSRLTVPALAVLAVAFICTLVVLIRGRKYRCVLDYGLSDAVIISGTILVFSLILAGLSNVIWDLPAQATAGLTPPKWHADYNWAKPALMLMGFWGAIGSNNTLLYLAGLSGVSQELYEAADIDGASPWQRFWSITWPQLSNITFFILIMAVIGGLQGGFEMAKAMTNGGPAGATTTLSYYIYIEGFSTGRLGYASAVSWTLFAMVFLVTLFNWKFGNRYTNE
ncbi:MAG: sugar ABC transporter permease [Lentisphaeria bacterium]|nr:sugar ABC transporter permease [Lentisphaeria bacterium]